MTIRTLNSTLKNSLMNYDPFVVAHLIKFEKPQSVVQYGGKLKGLATDYTYITDAQYDIEYDDGTTTTEGGAISAQLYRANKVTKLGTVNESIQAKASNMTLVLDSASLGASATTSATFTSSVMAGTVDLAAEGFQEGDKILLSGSGNTNDGTYVRIDSFQNDGKTITFTQISAISVNGTAQTYTVTLAAEELNTLLTDKASSSYTSYINREVIIYKVHINPATRAIIGAPYLYFKGITSGASINEKLDSSEITWTLSSHWGDFLRVQGRLTDDATHRALRSDGSPDIDSVVKPEYAGDLGFLHANTAINHIATYNTVEIEYKQVDINGGWPGGKRLREVEVNVPRQTDLQFNIQSKMLPVVYGVQKIDSFPIFVDTNKSSSAEVYRADALCEGPIAGVLDIYLEDNSTICLDKADFDTRDTSGTNFNADSVEIICSGRMDRGDTLAHYTGSTGSAFNFTGTFLSDAEQSRAMQEYFQTYQNVNYSSSSTGAANSSTGDATGILHRGTHSITSPLNASFTFHSGKENQKADDKLVSMAQGNQFKVQNDYYTGKAQYWSPSHRVLDTAYVVGKYTIAEGETTLPEMKFVVRGRDPECYNYDYSYKQDSSQTNASVGTFSLGDTVTLKKSNGNMSDASVTIIDKWSTFDSDGNRDHRFRFSPAPNLGTTTAFYMQKSTSNWHMQTWDHTENADDVAANLYHSSFSVAAGTNRGRKVTLTSPSTAFEHAVNHAEAIIGIYDTANSGLVASSYSDFSYDASTNIIDDLTRLTSDPGIDRIYVKNAIQLDSGASSTNDYYNGNIITLTDNSGEAPYIQERKIIDYDGATRVAIVDAVWDYNFLPSTSMTYSVGSVGDRRVTINPAMQLLDYMTNKRYGKGLDITNDISIDAWTQAARECDTRSNVTIAVPTSASVVAGEVYKYPSSGALQFMGTVESVATLGGKKQVVFKNVVGKLGTKWNSWQSFASGQLYWHNSTLYAGTGSVVATAPTGSGITLSLAKVGGGSLTVDLTSASANGNPVVKKYSTLTLGYTDSGYSLYDGDDVKYWRYLGWDDNSQRNVTRHQMNQVIDTKLPLFDNINKMLNQFNGILRYTAGKYELEVKSKKGTVDTAEQISAEDIIGTIKLSDKGLKNSKNYVSTSIIDPNNKFEGRSISFFNSTYLKEDKGIQKKGQFSLPGITNYFNARFNIKQYLDESRYGLTVQFTMAPRGLLLVAGSIIEFTYPRFGYTSKAFRITNLNFKKDGTVDVTADEHNDDAYVIQEGGNGYGVIEEPGAGQAPEPLPIPARPTNLQATQTNQGEVVLTWTNTSTFTSASHEVEIYRGTVNNFTDSSVTKIGSSTTDVYNDPISTGSGLTTRYYWIRYVVRMPQLNLAGSEFRNVPSLYYPNTDDSGFTNGEGITGIGLAVNAVRTIKLDPGTTSSFVYQNDETGIESGYATTTTITTTKTNDAGTVTYVWKLNDVVISGATSANYTYTPPNAFGDMPQKVSVHMTDTVGSETFTATDFIMFTATKIVVNGTIGTNGFTVTASNGTHNFSASSTGAISSVSSYSSTFTVLKGTTALTYDASGSPAANTYKLGSFANISPANSVVPVNTNGTVTISSSSGNLLSGTSVTQAIFDVPIIENDSGSTIAIFKMSITKTLDGGNGDPGVKTALVYAYQRSSSALTSNPGAVTVNLNNGTISTSTLANSWKKEIPSGTDPIYVVAASAAGTGSSDNIAANEWSAPVVLSQNGEDGLNSATITIYRKTNSASESTKPIGNTTYTFSGGGVSFANANNWSATIPNGTETYLWARTATASSTSATDIIADSEWSNAELLSVGGGDGVRGGGIFTFEESSTSAINATNASAYAGTLTTASAQAVAAAVIAVASDSAIRPNDRITVTDNSANKAGTRVYTGSAQTASASVSTGDFSSLVVETFDGSVIVDGTLSADKLAANTIIGNNIKVGSNLELNSDGAFYTTNKTSYTDNDAGFFLGYTGGAHKLNLGGATNYLKWNGSTLEVSGTIAMTGSSTIGGTTASTVVSGAADGATANQSTNAQILAGNVTGTIGGTANSTVASAHQTAGGNSSGNSRAFMNSSGLVVVDGSGTKRVKIGNLGSL